MAQNVQLSVSGLYTAPSDFAGLPPGSLDEAVNVESRHKNLLEYRRGFDGLSGSTLSGDSWARLTNFPVSGTDRVIGLSGSGDLYYYNGSTLVAMSGLNSGYVAPNALAKNRFVKGGQNLYITDQSGVMSFSSGSGSSVIRAGVPKGLNLQAETSGASSGFLTNNTVATTTGDVSSGSAIITKVDDLTDIAIGQYIAGSGIPAGTTITDLTNAVTRGVYSGTTTVGGTTISFASNPGTSAGELISGTGVQDGTKVVSQTGAGPYTVTIDLATVRAGTVDLTFSTPPKITMSQVASGSHSATAITAYSGAQVAYRMLFGRVETDINGNKTTRYGSPSAMAIATNTGGSSTNVTVTGTLPKNASDSITFVQLYRSAQTAGADITPLDQMNLCYERELEAADFTARVITITDEAPDSSLGIPLYTGTDREGILQANDPPPACWDMTVYRNLGLYANITQPSTLELALVAVGAPNGIQANDVITIVSGSTTRTYTAKAAESAASREFKVYTTGTPSQNIADTTASLIRVINYDEALPIHAILTSTPDGAPGQFILEADLPYGTFTATVSAHASAFSPELTNLESDVNGVPNGVIVSKDGELESTPAANLLLVGDSSANILRIIALRDYAIVLKTDGVYKILGSTASSLSPAPFDSTTKIIGPDTAVQLNSGVWMLSNQGVVSIDDAGVNAKSPPIDNILNELVGTELDNINDLGFGVGYESDRKYILSLPANSTDPNTSTQYVFNYVTNSWTTWDRDLSTAFIHGDEGKLYIGVAGATDGSISKERKTGTYTDYSDEDVSVTISSVTSSTEVVLADVSNVEAGDLLYIDSGTLSPITAVDAGSGAITLQFENSWSTGAATVKKAIRAVVKFKQVFGDNPAFCRQFPEGLALFKDARFNEATLQFATDFSPSLESVDLYGTLLNGWGLFPWGDGPWGGTNYPKALRFLVPADKQLGSYISPRMIIKQAWSTWKFQGMSMMWMGVSAEVGK